jgi:hypothetical protein
MKTAKREWTILLYTVADRPELRTYANRTLLDIDQTAGHGGVTTVAQVTLHSNDADPIRRYDFERSLSPERKTDVENKLQYLPQRDRGPRRNLIDFLVWGQQEYPAKRYCVVLQGHAWGADYSIPSFALTRGGEANSRHAKARLIFGSPRSKNHLNNKQLQKALSSASANGKFHLLGMDSCLMCMAEICYELRQCADFILAPEGLGPIAGWPFHPILKNVDREPSIGPAQLGATILKQYSAKYRHFGGNMKLTISLCSLRYSQQLMRAMKALVSSLLKGLENRPVRSAIIRARLRCEYFRMPNYIDLCHFCELLLGEPAVQADSALRHACIKVMAAIKQRFIEQVALRRGRTGEFGLSIFFPKWQIGGKKRPSRLEPPPLHDPFEVPNTLAKAAAKIDAAYADHEFADQSGWKKFLLKFVKARFVTRRPNLKARGVSNLS